jgi:hypothetical protein
MAVALAAGAGALVAGPESAVERLRKAVLQLEGFGRAPAERLRHHYAWMAVEPSAFDSYVTDYERHFGRIGRLSVPRADFFTRFLLCTNFFTKPSNSPDGEEPVRYTIFYEPTTSPCYNPLARRPPSDAEGSHPS